MWQFIFCVYCVLLIWTSEREQQGGAYRECVGHPFWGWNVTARSWYTLIVEFFERAPNLCGKFHYIFRNAVFKSVKTSAIDRWTNTQVGTIKWLIFLNRISNANRFSYNQNTKNAKALGDFGVTRWGVAKCRQSETTGGFRLPFSQRVCILMTFFYA